MKTAAKVITYNDTYRRAWDEYVLKSPGATVYHLIGWKDVIEKSFGHKAYYLLAEEHGSVSGVLPMVLQNSSIFGRFCTSLPFFNYGGVYADNIEINNLLINEAIGLAKNNLTGYIEFRDITENITYLPVKKSKVSMVLGLPDAPEELWKNFDAKLRNQIRKGEKSNLLLVKGGKEYLDAFYYVFANNMRDLGTPVYSKDFFKNMLETFPREAQIFCIYLKDKVVAAAFTIAFRNSIEVPWASWLRKYRAVCPNNFLYWKMIEYACQAGFKNFDFGRSSWDSGTFKFKQQWGAQPKQLYWHYWLAKGDKLPEINPANPKYKLLIACWKRLPLLLANFLGPKIAKYLP